MTDFLAAPWLEHARTTVQSVWFAGFGAALWATFWALQRPRNQGAACTARVLWAAAMMMLVAMWLGGATLEMMRRATLVSGSQLLIALGAFSLLLAGTISLASEWFGPTLGARLNADKIAFSPLVLTLAGWWFGGMALEENSLWFLAASKSDTAPDAWGLLVGGATLLGVSRSIRPLENSDLRARNPRPAMWWLVLIALFLAFPVANSRAASVFALAGAAFSWKIWRARRDCPRFLRAARIVRVGSVSFLGFLPLMWEGHDRAAWSQKIQASWQEPHQIAAWLLLVGAIITLLGPLHQTLRTAIFARFYDRALLQSALAGWALASLFFGPGGAVFWAFWPLCGVFFDLLTPRELFQSSRIASQLPA